MEKKMPPSTISFPPVMLISSILILIPIPNTIAARATPSLIRFACSDQSTNFDTKLCLQLLQTTPKIAAAKDLFNLSIAVIDAGISNSTATRRHMEAALNGTTGVRAAVEDCKLAYDEVVKRFTDALGEVRELEFMAPTYNLLTASTDYIKECKSALAKRKVDDAIISRGNRVVPIFGLSAYKVVGELDIRSRSPPPRGN